MTDIKPLAIIVLIVLLAMLGGTPGPGPDVDPDDEIVDPDPPVITAAGPHVLIIEETADRGRLSTEQLTALFTVSSWAGKRGFKWRVWDQQIDNQETDDPFWAAALALPRESLPWIVLADDDAGYSGPLPEDMDTIEDLVAEYE